MTPAAARFVQIDEEGYFKFGETRATDAQLGREWLSHLRMDDRGRAWTTIDDQPIQVEAFDDPLIALNIEKPRAAGGTWTLHAPYGMTAPFSLNSLRLDDWDRFHGRTAHGIPFVFSRPAQAEFFNLVDDYEDDSITFNGERIVLTPWLEDNPEIVKDAWWTEIYRTEEPRWDLHAPSHALPKLVPQLKLSRSRVLLLGAGTGNDAAWFADQGHIVTAVDFSEEAIARAQSRYGHLSNLHFKRADVFNLPQSMDQSFDLIFEHALYCAVLPSRRADLVKIWRRLLADNGFLMGVFSMRDKPFGPPFGGSEWELRARLEGASSHGKRASAAFRPLYWMRLHDSREARLGMELFVYAQKTAAF